MTSSSGRGLRPADARRLAQVLDSIAQGDLISLGAVSIVGRGPAGVLESAGVDAPAPDKLWALTVDSEVGWYVVLSGACDIVRDPTIEPCLTVCPVTLVEPTRYAQLRHGGYSPRELPLPAAKLAQMCGRTGDEAFCPVADQRYVASVDKTALVHPDVATLRPLTGPQQGRLALWAGRRYARAAHPDDVEEHVLKRAAKVVARLANSFDTTAQGKRTLPQQLVGATDAWLVNASGKTVTLYPVLTESLARDAGLFDTAASAIDSKAAYAAAKKLRAELAAAVTAGSGFMIAVAPTTWDAMTAAEYIDRPPWTWESDPDPLSE